MPVHVLIPGLRYHAGPGYDPLAGLQLPALSGILKKSVCTTAAACTAEDWLREQFGAAGVGAAGLTLALDLADAPARAGTILRADPVHVRIDRDRALLFDASAFSLTQTEADALLEALNQQFGVDGLHFFAPQPDRWYLQLQAAPEVETSPLSMVVGGNMHQHLPKGPGALRWHGYLNEIQMLLYNHPVNNERELAGKLPINSVWPWGEGAAATQLKKPYAQLYADDALALGLAHAAGVAHSPLPLSCPRPWPATSIIWLDSLLPAARLGDLDGWRAALEALEPRWLQPLSAQLQTGQLDKLTLLCPDPAGSLRFDIDRADRWKLWRKGATLKTLAL